MDMKLLMWVLKNILIPPPWIISQLIWGSEASAETVKAKSQRLQEPGVPTFEGNVELN